MTVSRTLSFVVGLALAGMAAMAALGDEASPPPGSGIIINDPSNIITCANCVHESPVSVRLDRIERLLREMCERTARFGGCEELRKQR